MAASTTTLFSLYIVNKSGGLIFNKDLSKSAPRLSGNDYLRCASFFHSLHAIASQLAPVVAGGIQTVEADTFSLQCLQTHTGLKFFITAKPGTPNLDTFLNAVYQLYCDYVLKNPFYELEMPIRCEKFEENLAAAALKFVADPARYSRE